MASSRPDREAASIGPSPAGAERRFGKKKGLEIIQALGKWWRWRESNPRPKALDAQFYMLSSPLSLVSRQHDVRSAPGDQPA